MDASRYLRLKTAACPQTLARSQCIDAGLRTDMVGKRAATAYISPNHIIPNPDVPFVKTCCTSRVAYGGGAVEPIHQASGCAAAAMCTDINNRYSAPFITLPGCRYPATASTLTEVGGGLVISKECACYQCPPGVAATREANYLCCHKLQTSG